MFFVVTFNHATEYFEYIGAFSKEDEAKEFAEANKTDRFAPVVHESTFKFVMDQMTQTRLGEMAQIAAVQGIAAWPALVWIVEKDGSPIGIFLSERQASEAFRTEDATRAFSVDVGLWSKDGESMCAHGREETRILFGEGQFPISVIRVAAPQ